jgi:methionyl-tRNA formyltransferase
LGGAVVKILRAEPAATAGDGPGVVVAIEPDALVVGAGTGAVRVEEVAPPGRRRMSGGDLARGARLAPGDRLG